MNKTKLPWTIILILMLCFIMLVPVYAVEGNDMVYASEKTQNEIYSMLTDPTFDYYAALQADNLTIVKESITRVYTVSLLDYAKEGTFNVLPMSSGGSDSVYVAKVITANGDYAGNIRFYVKNNTAYNLLFSPAPVLSEYYVGIDNPRYIASCSYADHAERIKGIFKRSSFVSVDKVKYIVIDGVVEGFLVQDDATFNIIPIGYISEAKIDAVDVNLTNSDVSALASEQLDAYNKQLKEKAEWEKEHPDEQWSFTGTSISPIISGVSAVNNVNNIYEYLDIPRNELPSGTPNLTPIVGSIIAVIVLVVFATSVYAIKKARLQKM